MDDLRLQVNEELMDTQAARIDDLERRLDVLLTLLRADSVCTTLGWHKAQVDRADPSGSPLRLRTMKHSNERHRAIDARRREEVLARLSHVSPQRLEEILRER